MKVLHIMPRFPYPPDDGGKIVLYNTIKYLSKFTEIHLLTFSNFEIRDFGDIEDYAKIYIINKNTKNSFSNILKYVLINKPIFVYKYYNRNILSFAKKLHKKNNFEFILCEHSSTGKIGLMLKKKFNIPLGHRLHNVEWKIWERFYQEFHKYSPKRYLLKQQTKLLKKFEIDLIKKSDINFTITETDKKYILKDTNDANVLTSSIGVDFDKWKVTDTTKNRFELIIATTYNWIHNINGLKWFIKKVLPLIKKEIPEVKLTLLGKNLPVEFKNFKDSSINPEGYVDDIVSRLNKAVIYIAPLFVGSGIRVKILEAMAVELPVIATKISAEGIKESNENGLFVSDNHQKQSEIILDLLKNPDKRVKYGKAARNFVINNYNWKNNINIIYNSLKNIANAKETGNIS